MEPAEKHSLKVRYNRTCNANNVGFELSPAFENNIGAVIKSVDQKIAPPSLHSLDMYWYQLMGVNGLELSTVPFDKVMNFIEQAQDPVTITLQRLPAEYELVYNSRGPGDKFGFLLENAILPTVSKKGTIISRYESTILSTNVTCFKETPKFYTLMNGLHNISWINTYEVSDWDVNEVSGYLRFATFPACIKVRVVPFLMKQPGVAVPLQVEKRNIISDVYPRKNFIRKRNASDTSPGKEFSIKQGFASDGSPRRKGYTGKRILSTDSSQKNGNLKRPRRRSVRGKPKLPEIIVLNSDSDSDTNGCITLDSNIQKEAKQSSQKRGMVSQIKYLKGDAVMTPFGLGYIISKLRNHVLKVAIGDKISYCQIPSVITSVCREIALYHSSSNKGIFHLNLGDLNRLRKGEYLNDSIVDFYLSYLVDHLDNSACGGLASTKDVYVFSSFFFNLIEGKSVTKMKAEYPSIKHWTKSVDLFSKKYLIIPINKGNHWSLMIVCNLSSLSLSNDQVVPPSLACTKCKELKNENTSDAGICSESVHAQQNSDANALMALKSSIYIKKSNCCTCGENVIMELREGYKPSIIAFDSIENCHRIDKMATSIRRYLMEELQHRKADSTKEINNGNCFLPLISPTNIPRQNNNCDCGVFLLHYAELFLKIPLADINQFICCGLKKKVLLKNSEIFHKWFSLKQVAAKRKNIQELILALQARNCEKS